MADLAADLPLVDDTVDAPGLQQVDADQGSIVDTFDPAQSDYIPPLAPGEFGPPQPGQEVAQGPYVPGGGDPNAITSEQSSTAAGSFISPGDAGAAAGRGVAQGAALAASMGVLASVGREPLAPGEYGPPAPGQEREQGPYIPGGDPSKAALAGPLAAVAAVNGPSMLDQGLTALGKLAGVVAPIVTAAVKPAAAPTAAPADPLTLLYRAMRIAVGIRKITLSEEDAFTFSVLMYLYVGGSIAKFGVLEGSLRSGVTSAVEGKIPEQLVQALRAAAQPGADPAVTGPVLAQALGSLDLKPIVGSDGFLQAKGIVLGLLPIPASAGAARNSAADLAALRADVIGRAQNREVNPLIVAAQREAGPSVPLAVMPNMGGAGYTIITARSGGVVTTEHVSAAEGDRLVAEAKANETTAAGLAAEVAAGSLSAIGDAGGKVIDAIPSWVKAAAWALGITTGIIIIGGVAYELNEIRPRARGAA